MIARVSRHAAADVAAWLAALAAYALLAWPDLFHVSGDALIHFVYAVQAAAGRWFQFNPGEPSAGSTSVLYTTAMALLVRALGLPVALYVACAACLVAVAALLWIVCREVRRATGSAAWAAVACLAVALNPGFAYNSPQGIEAPFFALAVAALLFRDPAWATARPGARTSLAAAMLAALVVALRPEGAVVLAVLLMMLASARRPDGRRVGVTGPLALAAAAGGAAILLTALWQWRWTGVFLPASAYSRLMLARRQGLHLGPLWIYPGFVTRLAAYAPLTAGTIAAPWLLREDRDGPGRVWLVRIAAVVLAAIVLLYTFVTGAAHVARYMMFLLAPMAVVATLAARTLWASTRGRLIVALAAAALLAAYGADAGLRARVRRHSGSDTIAKVVSAYWTRVASTDRWIAQTGYDLERCGPMRLSYQEVQIALELDDRTRIVSTDGRVWPIGLSGLYRSDGTVDGARWIEALKPNVLVELPDDPALDEHLSACRSRGADACPYAGVSWVWRPPGVWVDAACVR